MATLPNKITGSFFGSDLYTHDIPYKVTYDPSYTFNSGTTATSYTMRPDNIGGTDVYRVNNVQSYSVTGDTAVSYLSGIVTYSSTSPNTIYAICGYVKSFQYKNNLRSDIKTRANIIRFNRETDKEQTAIDSLREMITELEFRKYIKYGFILVKGKSGKVYQIFRDSYHTKVYENGKLVEKICVRIKDKEIPLTDNVIAFKTMIDADENYFHQVGNVYNMRRAA